MSDPMVSIVIPAYRAEATLGDAVRSVFAQTLADWECIVVSDDGVDYPRVLHGMGLSDSRLRHVSTGAVGSGCHAARNRGLTECRGNIVGALDADDVWLPRRLQVLAPQALRHGAAADGPRVVTTDGTVLYEALGEFSTPIMLEIPQLLDLTCPLFPLTRRDVTFARTAGIEHLEDVVSNLLLISNNGPMWATPKPLMEYRVVTGSMCHADDSANLFDTAYTDLIERVKSGRLAILPELRAAAIAGLERKRALNKRFDVAQRGNGGFNFQTFAAAQRRASR
jgi:succinoglycan biosynthesis protein ExoO